MADSKISEMIQNALENIKKVADANTIIGEPINTVGDTIIIPVSKVSLGFTSGGNDYISKHADKSKNGAETNFIGGTGAGVTVSP
jgi:sporulation protein YtfJ